jgi:hypothetical protein
MKRKIFPAAIKSGAAIFTSMVIMVSCSKSSSNPSGSGTVSEEEAAEAAVEVVAHTSGGMVAQVDDATIIVINNTYPCGESFDSAISKSNANGAAITYSVNINWDWMLNCTSPANFSFDFSGHYI